MPRDHYRDSLNRYIVKTGDDFRFTLSRAVFDSGERRLPACRSRQLAETRIRDHHDNTRKNIAGKLPAIAGWQPALPRTD
jgi:hypothetical protein